MEDKRGIYGVYGTGGLITYANSFLTDKPTVCIGRKGTIDKPLYFEKPIWTVDTLFYSEIKETIPKFVYYLFQTIDWKIYNQSTGVPSLTSDVIEKIKVYIPNNCNEQIKITSVFSLLDQKLTIITSKINTLKKYKEGLINWWFNKTGKHVKLNDLVIQKPSQLLTNQIKKNLGDYPVYDAAGKIYKHVDFYNTNQDSIAIIKYGSGCGRTFIAKGKHNVLGTMTEMIPVNPEDLIYIEAYTKSQKFRRICKKYTEIGTTPNLYFSDYSNCLLFYPDDRNRLIKVLEAIYELESNLTLQFSSLKLLKKQLLNYLFI